MDSLFPGLVVRRRRRPFTLGVHRGGLLGHRRRKDADDDVDAVTPTALSIIIYPPLSFLPLPPHSLCCVYVRNLGSATAAAAAVIELCWVKPENVLKLCDI